MTQNFIIIDAHFEAKLPAIGAEWTQIGQSNFHFGELMANHGEYISDLFRDKSTVYESDDIDRAIADHGISVAAEFAMDAKTPDVMGIIESTRIHPLLDDTLGFLEAATCPFPDFQDGPTYSQDYINAIGEISEDMFGVDFRKLASCETRIVWFGYVDKREPIQHEHLPDYKLDKTTTDKTAAEPTQCDWPESLLGLCYSYNP